jgi:hypothetical protein
MRNWRATVRPHWSEIVLAAAFGVVAAVVGGAQVLIYIRQADIMRNQAEIAKSELSTSRLRDRAFVYFTNIGHVPHPPDAPVNWAMTIDITNTGNTAARHVSVRFSCSNVKAGVHPPEYGTRWDYPLQMGTDIGPKQTVKTLYICNEPLSEIEAVRQGERHIFVYLLAEYLDGLDLMTIRRTELAQSLSFDPAGEMLMRFYDTPHNCSDEDCPKE